MIIRIVRMEFRAEETAAFLELFHASKDRIRNFPGCMRLELLRDVNTADVFFTYSWWESEAHLDKYRFSDLFRDIWTQTKVKFAAKAQAWSLAGEAGL